jgi:type VI secretion system protein ImpL
LSRVKDEAELMAAVKRVLTNWWFVSILVAILLVLILCVGLPIFVGFLRPWWVKLLLFVIVAGGWGLLAFLRVRKGRKGSEAIAAELAQASDAEGRQLADRMTEALRTMRTANGKKRRDYLYSRPWYMIIGPPGAGKTTALLNSGLRFPLEGDALRGVGGTRNVDFLFADEAILVDTAGRYTSQDSDASADAKGWTGFLSLLRKHRPLQPINGVIVAIGVDEIMRGDRMSIDRHAASVRRRLAELRATLEVAAPVYVLLTKADLLAGFVEYYDDLDVEGRRAVLGQTLPFSTAKPGIDKLAAAFDDMARAIEARQAMRLATEPDAQRRALILGFPAQVTALRARLLRFLDGAFVAGDDNAGILRGFYLTSGVQQGTPLDRILSDMADVYDQPRQADMRAGRAYFLNCLLGEVMFPEAGLVQTDPAARRRQRAQLIGTIAGIALLSLLVLALWGVSFARNRTFQSQMIVKADAAAKLTQETGLDLVEVRDSDPGLDQSLDTLRALRDLPRGYADAQRGGAPLTMRFGLYQSSLAAQGQDAYREGLRRILLPRILLQLEHYLQQNLGDPLTVYEPLKVYLMLGAQGPMDRDAVKSWVNSYWANTAYPGADAAATRKELGQHLDALLADADMARAWADRRAPLNGALIAQARMAVQRMSMAERAYAILRQKAFASGGPAWTVSSVLASADTRAFANGDAVLQGQVPFFFTRAGYERAYQVGLATVQGDLRKDLWVLGGDADTTAVREQIGEVRSGVAGLYAKDYIAAWDKIVAAMQPAAYFQDVAALAAITRAPSPLKLILLEVRKNSTFAGGSRAAGGMITQKLMSKLGQAGQLAPQGGGTLDASQQIESYFAALRTYVGDGKAPAPIDDFLAALRSASTALQTAQMTGGGLGGEAVQGQMNAAMAQVAVAAAGAPPQLQPFVAAAAKGGSTARVSAVSGAVSDAYAQTVMPACKAASQDRYPFFQGSATEVSLIDAQRVFGPGGVIDAFVQQRLLPVMDTSSPIWRWKDGDPVVATLDPASPDSFAKAAQIRDLIAGGLVLRVELASFQGSADAVQFSTGDSSLRFDGANRAAKQVRWSAQSGAPQASVTLYHGTQELRALSEQGIWALFRLMDQARRENAGPTTILATFGDGTNGATLRIGLPDEHNPFGRGGLWTFRCPITL